MAIIGDELEDYVIKQIKARQTLHGSGVGHTGTLRTDKQINLLNSNTSWIKLASGVSIDEARLKDIGLDPSLSDTILAENFVLFSGVSRIRKNIVEGQITLHPSGIPHGPHPGTMEKSIGKKETAELAVMVDTFKPLMVTEEAMKISDESYYQSWLEES